MFTSTSPGPQADIDDVMLVKPYPCCIRCGFMPIEGMAEYLRIHGDKAKCIICDKSLADERALQPFPASTPECP